MLRFLVVQLLTSLNSVSSSWVKNTGPNSTLESKRYVDYFLVLFGKNKSNLDAVDFLPMILWETFHMDGIKFPIF